MGNRILERVGGRIGVTKELRTQGMEEEGDIRR